MVVVRLGKTSTRKRRYGMTLQEYLRVARDNDVRHLDKMPHPQVDSWKMLTTIMTEHGPKPLILADMSWLRQAIVDERSLFLNGS